MANSFNISDQFSSLNSQGVRKTIVGQLTVDKTVNNTAGISLMPAALKSIGGNTGLSVLKNVFVGYPNADVNGLLSLTLSGTNLSAALLKVYWDSLVVTGEAVTMAGSANNYSGTLVNIPTQILAAYKAGSGAPYTTWCEILAAGATLITGAYVAPTYTTGKIATYDNTSTYGMTVDYVTNGIVQANQAAANIIIPVTLIGY